MWLLRRPGASPLLDPDPFASAQVRQSFQSLAHLRTPDAPTLLPVHAATWVVPVSISCVHRKDWKRRPPESTPDYGTCWSNQVFGEYTIRLHLFSVTSTSTTPSFLWPLHERLCRIVLSGGCSWDCTVNIYMDHLWSTTLATYYMDLCEWHCRYRVYFCSY